MWRPRGLSAGLVFVDQATNSITNFAFTAIVAANTSSTDFGIFAIAQLLILVAQMAAQTGFGDILLRSEDKAAVFQGGSRLLTICTAVAVGVVGTILLIHGMSWWVPTALLGIAIPRLDHIRTFLLAGRSRTLAIAMDAVYGACQVAAVTAVSLQRSLTLTTVFSIWLGAAVVAHLFIAATRPLRTAKKARARPRQVFSWRYASEQIIFMGSGQVTQLLASGVLGLTFAAGIRGAQMLYGPVALMLQASRVILVPRFASPSTDGHQRSALVAALTLGSSNIAWLILLWMIYPSIGALVLGQTAGLTAPLLFPMAIAYATQAAHSVMFLRARACALDRQASMSRICQIIGLFLGTCVALFLESADAYIWGWAAANTLAIIPLVSAVKLRNVGFGDKDEVYHG